MIKNKNILEVGKMKKMYGYSKLYLVVTLVCVLFSVTKVYATTRYVHPDGNNSWNGISTFTDDDGPYQTIQYAIDQSWPNDIIKVANKAGLDPDYELSAPIQLYHADHHGLTVEWWTEGERPQVKGAYGWDVFRISVPDVTIKGFDIYTYSGSDGPGILLKEGADNCYIMNNRCGYDATHKCTYGIQVQQVTNTTISNNECSYNTYGIYLWYEAGDNTITDNIVNNNSNYGIYVYNSNDNNIHGNTCNNNSTGIYLNTNSSLSNSNSVWSNTCNENSKGIYLYGVSNNTLSGNITKDNTGHGISLDANNNFILGSTSEDNGSDGIYLAGSQNNILFNNYCNSNDDDGIELNGSYSNSLSGNTCRYNDYSGVYFINSHYNNLSGNTLSSNYEEGIYFENADANIVVGNDVSSNGWDYDYQMTLESGSDNNEFYMNTFDYIDNPVNSTGSSNTWNSPVKLSYLYENLINDHKGYMGNYFSDYYGDDTDDDGVGNTLLPYSTDGSNDSYPLIEDDLTEYDFKTWWFGTSEVMYSGNVSKMGQLIFVNSGSSYSWFDENSTDMAICFGGGSVAAETVWSGQITFTTAPSVGDNFTVKIGYADDAAGNGFISGPQATINGDESTKIFTFTANETLLSVPENKYIGLKLENNGSVRYYVRVGASWSYCSSSSDITYPGTDISAQSGNWEDIGIWGNNAVPTGDDDVIIQNGHSVTVNSTANCEELILYSSSNLLLNDDLPSATNGYNFDSASTVNYCKTSRSGDQTISSTPVYGNLTISGDGTKTINGSLQTNGNLTVQGSATLHNNGQLTVDGIFNIQGSSTFTMGNTLDANGNISISSDATINGGNHNINIAGDWSNLGTWNYNTSTVVFDESASDQTIGPAASSGGEIQVGTGTYNIDDYPFCNTWENNRTQMLYLGSEIGQSGDINGIQFDLNQVSPTGYRDFTNFTVKLKETTDANWYNLDHYVDMTGAATVFFQNPYTMPGATGWFTISFTTPFSYNNANNLIVEIIWGDNGTYTFDSYELAGTTLASGHERVLYGYSDSETPPSFDLESNDQPNIKFNLQAAGGAKNFYNLTVSTAGSPGTTTSQADLHIHNNLVISSGSELVMGENELTVDGTTTYNGPVSYTKTESPANGVAATYTMGGMDNLQITPSGGDMGSTEAVVKKGTVCPNNAFGSSCTNTPLSVKRYFNISPTTPQTATIKFCYLTNELNGQTHGSGMKVYNWNSSSSQWEAVGTYVSSGGAGTTANPYYVEYSGLSSYSPFVLGSEGDPTLPVVLSTFTAQFLDNVPTLCWTTQSETNNMGWNIYRSENDSLEQSLQINTELIPGAGTCTQPTEYTFEDECEVYADSTYWYWLESVEISGISNNYGPISLTIPEGEDDPNSPEIPKIYGLYQNYPNPFNPETEIGFTLKKDSNVYLTIYNLKGQRVVTLLNNKFVEKDRVTRIIWYSEDANGRKVSSGIYFYELKTNNKNYQKKMLLLK